MSFQALPNEVVKEIFAYSIHEYMDWDEYSSAYIPGCLGSEMATGDMAKYRILCSYASVCRKWVPYFTSSPLTQAEQSGGGQ